MLMSKITLWLFSFTENNSKNQQQQQQQALLPIENVKVYSIIYHYNNNTQGN